MGYYCVDNMPVSLMPRFAELCSNAPEKYKRVALVTDVRTLDDFGDLFDALRELRTIGVEGKILFVDASNQVIVKRYKESRRRHPLAVGDIGLPEAVSLERERLDFVRQKADYIVDTSELTLGQLQRTLSRILSTGRADQQITVSLVTFGYKNGVPIDADLVFDVRCLPNPYYVDALRHKTGLDKEVRDYVFSSPVSEELFSRIRDLLLFLLPQYIEEGKHVLVVAVGCTGGHHRSVAVAAALGEALTEHGYYVRIRHRDLEKV